MYIHKSVLLQEVIDGLDIKSGEVFVDGTLGGGGHLEEVAKRFGNTVVMIGIDLDPEALSRSQERLYALNPSVYYMEGSFRNIDQILAKAGFSKVNKVLFDLGLSSNQIEQSGRGFSFQRDEPLIMTFKKNLSPEDLTAREILNNWDEENIRAILEGYGQEKFAYKIAKAIVEKRKEKPIETTFQLVEIIKSATPTFYHHKKIHPATKTFQALRIAVNDEIESLKEGMTKGFECLNKNGRLAIVSFHSLEDRLVKQYFKKVEELGHGVRVNKKPIVPNQEEITSNSRSRSAKLRIIEKLQV